MTRTIETLGWSPEPGEPITDATLEGREWVMRWRNPYCGEVERRPVSMPPESNGIYYIDHGTPLRMGRTSFAFFKDGEWLRSNRQPWKAKPTHYSKVPGLPEVFPNHAS